MKRRRKILTVLEYACFCGAIILAPITAVLFSHQQVKASPSIVSVAPAPEMVLPIMNPGTSVEKQPLITAQHALAIDAKTGGVLFEKNAYQTVPPASLTKLLTSLAAIDTYSTDHVFTVKDEWQTDGNRAKLLPGEQLSRDDLLKALLIFSGNDAAEVLANHFPTQREGFIEEMNSTAIQLGAVASSFQNPSGLDHPELFSTAYDLGLIFRAVIKNPTLFEIIQTEQTTISSLDGKFQHVLYSTNALLGRRSEMIAGKTGSTDLAGQCFIALVEIDGHQVIIVILNSQERFTDTATLIDWLEDTYNWQTVKYVSETQTDE